MKRSWLKNRGNKPLKRTPLKRGKSQLKRSWINKIGRQGEINIEANKIIAERWRKEGKDSCEIKLPGSPQCLGTWTLQNVHRHKRVWYRDRPELLHHRKQVARGCQNCHDKMEPSPELTEEVFNRLRGDE